VTIRTDDDIAAIDAMRTFRPGSIGILPDLFHRCVLMQHDAWIGVDSRP
jgi:hypothetical protein